MMGWNKNSAALMVLESYIKNLITYEGFIFGFCNQKDENKLYKRTLELRESTDLLCILNVLFENYKS